MQQAPISHLNDLRTKRTFTSLDNFEKSLFNLPNSRNQKDTKNLLKNSLLLNSNKYPKDWLTPLKSIKKSQTRQTLSTRGNTDSNSSDLARSSDLRNFQKYLTDSPKKASLIETQEKGQRTKIRTLESEPSKNINTQKNVINEKIDPSNNFYKCHYPNFDSRSVEKNSLKENPQIIFEYTFGPTFPKQRQFSIKNLQTGPFPEDIGIIQEPKATPKFKPLVRSQSEQKIPLFKSKQVTMNGNQKTPSTSRYEKQKTLPTVSYKSQQIEKILQEKSIRKYNSFNESYAQNHKSKLSLPRIDTKRGNN